MSPDFIDHANIVELLPDRNDDALCFMKSDLVFNFSPSVPRQTHHRNGTESIEAEVKISILDRIHQIQDEKIPISDSESVEMNRQSIGSLLQLSPSDFRLLIDNGQFVWKGLGVSIQQVKDGQIMPQCLCNVSLARLLREGVPSPYQFLVRLLPCHSCHSLPCHLSDSSVEGHPKHSFLMGQ